MSARDNNPIHIMELVIDNLFPSNAKGWANHVVNTMIDELNSKGFEIAKIADTLALPKEMEGKLTNEQFINVINVFATTFGMFNENLTFGTDHDDLAVFVVQTHDQMDSLENFVKAIEMYLPDMVRADDVVKIIFYDEVDHCVECGKVLYTQPSYYGDVKKQWTGEYGTTCGKCTDENPDGYLEHLTNNPATANVIFDDDQMKEFGFVKLEAQYESGFHYGQTDNPIKILRTLEDKWDEIIFQIDNVGQFDVHFSVWVKGNKPTMVISTQKGWKCTGCGVEEASTTDVWKSCICKKEDDKS